MRDYITINIRDKNSEVLIKLSSKIEYLEQIRNGKIRFKKIDYYLRYEDENIGDKEEGIRSKIYNDKDLHSIKFFHPLLPKEGIDIKKSISSGDVVLTDRPNLSNLYIASFLILSAEDIISNKFLDDKIIEAKEWKYFLIFNKTDTFINAIHEQLKKNDIECLSGKVEYKNYDKTQDNLTVFNKSGKFSYQKEYRFAFYFNNKYNENLIKIDDETIELNVSPECCGGFFLPTNECRNGQISVIK